MACVRQNQGLICMVFYDVFSLSQLIGYLLNYKTPKQDNFNPVLQLELILAILRQLSVNPDIR